KSFFEGLTDDIISGGSFSEEVRSEGEFSEYECYTLEIVEGSGLLPVVTQELGACCAKKNDQRRALIAALTYPAIIMVTSVLVVVFMLRLVVPMFQDIFTQNNVELPWITKVIMKISLFIGDYGWLLLMVLFLLLISLKWIKRNKTYKRHRDTLLLRVPFVGVFYKTVYLSQFTQAVSLLTFSKVPMLSSIQLVGKMIDFYPLQHALEKVEQSLLKGNSLSKSMTDDPFFDQK